MAPRMLQVLFRLEALRDRSSNAGDWYTEHCASAALDAAARASTIEEAEAIESALMRELKWLYSAATEVLERCFRGGAMKRARLAATLIILTGLAVPAVAFNRSEVRVDKIETLTSRMPNGSDFTLHVNIYRRETIRPDGTVKVEFFRDAELKDPIDTTMKYAPRDKNLVSVEMDIGGSKSEFEIGGGRAHVIYDKVTGEVLEIDPLNDDTADS